jgi:hypothetical protein
MIAVGRDSLSLSRLPDTGKPRLISMFLCELAGDLEYAAYSGERFLVGWSFDPFERLKHP